MEALNVMKNVQIMQTPAVTPSQTILAEYAPQGLTSMAMCLSTFMAKPSHVATSATNLPLQKKQGVKPVPQLNKTSQVNAASSVVPSAQKVSTSTGK